MKTAAVLWCRNDDYKEDERVITCLNSMVDTFDEVWYFDWNSSLDKGSLFWKVQNRINKTGKIKHIVIPPEIASQLSRYPDAGVVNGMIPPNSVFRRTDADWIVTTTIDVIAPNKETFTNFLNTANKNTFYTLSRRDIEIEDLEKFGFDKWKEYRDILDKTTEERRFYAQVTPNDRYSLINCCGDFQLAHRDLWVDIKGFEEEMVYACFNDTNVQKKAVLNGFGLEAVFDIPLYHMSHKGMANDGSSPNKQKYNDPWEWIEYFSTTQNTDDWGLNGIEIEYETY
jgi:hypothetical protein